MSFPVRRPQKKKDTDYEIGELLGRGNFVSVYRAVEIATGVTYALKVVDRYRCDKLKKTNDLYMEKHCLLRCNHPNIIKMFAHFTDTLTVFVVMEDCSVGELWDLIKTVGCPDPTARHYFLQLINAAEYLRQARIVHRDIKDENILINGEAVLKLIDFGTAKDLENPQIKGSGNASRNRVFEDYVGTAQFMAPEVIENKSSDFRSDTWSLGCTFFQTLVGCPPFHAASEYLVYCKITEQKLEFPPGVNSDAVDLISKMVVTDPDERLGAHDIEQVKNHAYFSGCVFEGAHARPQPVPSLVDCCLGAIGRRMKEMQTAVKSWPGKAALRPQISAVLERMQVAQKWRDDAIPGEESV
eukprot:TRINITY_DN48283_c0_g1_i1.p1 TRINITY_DN48283_c0_g1~~TRINITY_DN48283_c0_g1_i1.p1  ORF type:complete len:355 (+),score=50.79 TRINITY_DN48283_c0_g1_i1:81-1145(+)